jgi:hypothetical protein
MLDRGTRQVSATRIGHSGNQVVVSRVAPDWASAPCVLIPQAEGVPELMACGDHPLASVHEKVDSAIIWIVRGLVRTGLALRVQMNTDGDVCEAVRLQEIADCFGTAARKIQIVFVRPRRTGSSDQIDACARERRMRRRAIVASNERSKVGARRRRNIRRVVPELNRRAQ